MTLCLVLAVTAINSFVLALHLAPGDQLVEHSNIVDRIAWVLPKQRLEAFRSQGIVVDEDVQTDILGDGRVDSVSNGIAAVTGTVTTTVVDVPRHRTATTHQLGISRVNAQNIEVGSTLYAVESAPMIGLPTTPLTLGSHWTTKLHVLTSLGSGNATFQHVVAAIDGARVRVDVTGAGTITGKEYNLPKLLPGTIHLSGSAWFDLASGLVEQESYSIDNTLVKPAGGESIGFVESLYADTDVHKKGRTLGRINSTTP